ncbi:MAG: hypothetical protein K0M40_02430 [Prolixibacteraceae bacterium]|nr:hypothetical protein [Prolixibacteraceae bacterium]
MNASYFVLVAAVLTFATGFFVATIIWGIKMLLAPKEERVSSKSVHLLHIFSPHCFGASHNDNYSVDAVNKELFRYYHGNSDSKSESVSNESVINKELYNYYHGKN